MNPRGQGPNSVQTVVGDKVVVVGDHPNIHPSLRTDPSGIEIKNYGITGSSGMTESPSAIPTFESVDNGGDFHGGTYTVTALNGIHFESAGGGATIDSSGNVAISSWGGKLDLTSTAQTGVKAQVVHIMGTNTVRISGPTFYVDTQETIFANKVTFGTNICVNGGAFINGELFARHITAPHSVSITADSPTLYGYPQSGASFEASIVGGVTSDGASILGTPVEIVISGGGIPIVSIPPHNHKYDGISSTQADGMTDFFDAAKAAESNEPAEAKPNLLDELSLTKFGNKMMKMITKHINDYIKHMLGF